MRSSQGNILNISDHGALVFSDSFPGLGENVLIRLKRPVQSDWAGSIVVRHDQQYEVAIDFSLRCPYDLVLAATLGTDWETDPCATRDLSTRLSSSPGPGRRDEVMAGLWTLDPGTPASHGWILHPEPPARPGAIAPHGLPAIPGYELLQKIGEGGMGVVYLARQTGLNRRVAVKMIRGGSQARTDRFARFRIEAEAVARLRHPNIIQIHEIGEVDGLPFVSLELLEGGSLADRLEGTPQPARQTAELLMTLASAIQVAHDVGIVHRDLKPSNVLFTEDGIPIITDFGLAKRIDSDSRQTETGQIIGSPSNMAPEQARGHTREVGPAVDVYALGAILYEMLTGRPPFNGETPMETVYQLIYDEVVPPSRLVPKVHRDLETICLKCLAKEPNKRYSTAKALAEDLHRYLAGEPIRARRTSVVGRGLKWARRKPAAALLLMVTMAALMGLTGAGLWYRDHLRDQQRREGERIAELRTKNTVALFKAQDDLEQKEWGRAEATLSTVFAAIEHQPQLDDLRARSIILLEQARRGLEEQKAWREDRARFNRFHQLRDEALLLDTDFTGLDLPSNVGATRQTARDVLEIFAEKEPRAGWALAPLPSSFSVQEQAEVTEGCCELILVWAEAMARPLPHTEEAGRQASQALQILDLTAKLPPSARPTRAYHLRRAEFLTVRGDTAGAGGERAQADRLQPATAFDHFLYGHELYKRGRWTEAIDQFEATLRMESGHFWARCLLAICELQTQRPAEARIILSGCIQLRPNFAWLHLLRGFANSQVGVLDLKAAPRQAVGETDPIPASTAARFAEAEADYRQAMQLFRPSDDVLRYALLVNRGSMRLQRRELTDALADLQAAVQLKPRLFHAYTHLAEAFRQQGLWDRAIDQLDRAIDLRPDRQYLASLYRSRAGMQLERRTWRRPCTTGRRPSGTNHPRGSRWGITRSVVSFCIEWSATRRRSMRAMLP